MSKKVDLRKIAVREIFTISEIAEKLNLTPATIRTWGKKGLIINRSIKPAIIDGDDLKEFLKSRHRAKIKLKQNQFKCARCKKAVIPQFENFEIFETGRFLNKNGVKQIILKAVCPICGCQLRKFSSTNKISEMQVKQKREVKNEQNIK